MDWDWNRYYEPDDRVVWQYRHDRPLDIFGRAIVESSNDGVRAYCRNKDIAKKIKKIEETFGFVKEVNKMIKPTKIIYSGRKTIVFWNDGTKTMVTRNPEDQFDAYTAFCAALAKKMFNTTSSAKRMVDKISVFQNSRDDNTLIERTEDDQGNADPLVVEVPYPNWAATYKFQPTNKSDLKRRKYYMSGCEIKNIDGHIGTNEVAAVANACKDFADSMAKLGIVVGDISIKFGKSAADALKNAINKRKGENK